MFRRSSKAPTPDERKNLSESGNILPDESNMASSEFNDDPQWRMLFLDQYEKLVKQEEADGETTQYECVESDEKSHGSLLSMLASAVGDLTSITIPIGYIEPTSFLQRLCEAFQYSELLDKAADETDEFMRLAYIAAFFISAHSNNIRLLKPFNPLLGETFEYVQEGEHPFQFIAEQVSHHPPIAATHTHNSKWELWDEKRVSSKFGGNSLSMDVLGTFHLVLKTTDEHFSWKAVNCTVNNVVVGSMWVEHSGTTTILNHKTNSSAKVEMIPSSWLSRNRYSCKVSVCDGKGKEQLSMSGKWNESLQLKRGKEKEVTIWTATPRKPHPFEFSEFTEKLIKIDDVRRLAPTDSRLRPDRLLLVQGNKRAAGGAKKMLENKQREAKKIRIERELTWQPRFFVASGAGTDDPNEWQFNGRYWAMRDARLAALEKSKESSKESKKSSNSRNSTSSKASNETDDDSLTDENNNNTEDGDSKNKKTSKKKNKRKKRKDKANKTDENDENEDGGDDTNEASS